MPRSIYYSLFHHCVVPLFGSSSRAWGFFVASFLTRRSFFLLVWSRRTTGSIFFSPHIYTYFMYVFLSSSLRSASFLQSKKHDVFELSWCIFPWGAGVRNWYYCVGCGGGPKLCVFVCMFWVFFLLLGQMFCKPLFDTSCMSVVLRLCFTSCVFQHVTFAAKKASSAVWKRTGGRQPETGPCISVEIRRHSKSLVVEKSKVSFSDILLNRSSFFSFVFSSDSAPPPLRLRFLFLCRVCLCLSSLHPGLT